MKLLFLAKSVGSEAGGLGRHVLEVSKRLVEKGCEVTVLTQEDMTKQDHGFEVVIVPKKNLPHNVLENYSTLPKVNKFLKERGEEFDIVHGHEVFGSPGYRHRSDKNYRYVYTVHGLAYNLISREKLKPLAKILHYPERRACKKADKVVAVSENTKKEVVEEYKVDPGKVEVIYNGVDTEKFRPTKSFENRVLYVGEFLERKGSVLLVKAFSNVLEKFEHAELVLVGKGRLEEKLRKLVNDLEIEDNVVFKKNVTDEELVDLYSSSVFVMPSSYEGQGIVYVEAMACGSPVIGCDNSAIPEMIENGSNGFLIDRKVEEIEKALEKLFSNPEKVKKMGENARKTAGKFSWDEITEKTLKSYKKFREQP